MVEVNWKGSGNNEMNLMVDGDVVIGGDGQVTGTVWLSPHWWWTW